MKVLLDENLDRRYRLALLPHEAFSTVHMGWAGLKNGVLMRTALDAGFQVLLTGDQTLPQEQNLQTLPLAIVILSRTEWKRVRPYLEQIIGAIEAAKPGEVTRVDCGSFSRKKTGASSRRDSSA